MTKPKTTRRAYQRFKSNMAIWIRPSGKEAEFVLVEIDNIGGGGLLFMLDQKIELGTKLEIRFELPQISDLVEASASVRHVQQVEDGNYSIGVQFLEVQNFSIPILMAYLEALYT